MKIPTLKPPTSIFAQIRKNHHAPIPKGNQKAADYKICLNQYVKNKMLAERLERRDRYSMVEWVYYKEQASHWRAKMDLIEFDRPYDMNL